MGDHPNVALAQRALATYAAKDFAGMREFLSDDIVWHVGGKHRLSGDYRGVDAVVDYFTQAQELSGGSLTLEPIEVMADDEFGAIILRAVGDREGRRLDVTLAEAFKLDAQGRWAEYWALANDQRSVDQFWGED